MNERVEWKYTLDNGKASQKHMIYDLNNSQPVFRQFSFAYLDSLSLDLQCVPFTRILAIVLHKAYYDNQWIPAICSTNNAMPENKVPTRIERLRIAVWVWDVCTMYFYACIF